jgi:hypothetical protein
MRNTTSLLFCLALCGLGTVACGPSVDSGNPPVTDAAVDRAPANPNPCPPGQDLCGTVCTSLRNDEDNCGTCGTVCTEGQACIRGVCQGGTTNPPAPPTCMAGRGNCDGNDANGCEADLASVATCGACNVRCASGQNCASGRCVTPPPVGPTCGNGRCETGENCNTCSADCGTCAPTCTTGWANCDGNNTNGCETSTSMDARNCGACGRVCASGQVCNAGACTNPPIVCGNGRCEPGETCGSCPGDCGACAPSCTGGLALCSGSCVNTQTDANNCGACNARCTSGQTCSGGVCTAPTCAPGLNRCGGVCTSLLMDDRNCGACGADCAAVGWVCNAGRCADPRPTCSGSGMTYCGSRCINVYTDPTNCGRCGTVCGSGQVCSMGTCRSGMASDLSSIRVWYRSPTGTVVQGIGIHQLFDHAPSPGYLQPPCSVSGGMSGAFTSHTCGVLGRIPLSRRIVLNTQVQLSPSESTRLSGRVTTWACAIYTSGGPMQVYGAMGAELDSMSIPLVAVPNGYDGCNFEGVAP